MVHDGNGMDGRNEKFVTSNSRRYDVNDGIIEDIGTPGDYYFGPGGFF